MIKLCCEYVYVRYLFELQVLVCTATGLEPTTTYFVKEE